MEPKTYGQIAYEAYWGCKSLATGADLPQWSDLHQDIRDAWQAAARALVVHILGGGDRG